MVDYHCKYLKTLRKHETTVRTKELNKIPKFQYPVHQKESLCQTNVNNTKINLECVLIFFKLHFFDDYLDFRFLAYSLHVLVGLTGQRTQGTVTHGPAVACSFTVAEKFDRILFAYTSVLTRIRVTPKNDDHSSLLEYLQ